MDTSPAPRSSRRTVAGRRTGRAAQARSVNDYADQVRRKAMRMAMTKLRGRAFDADDVAQRVVERLAAKPEEIMAKYPNPDVFAAVAIRGELIDFGRREHVQRCEGVDGARTSVSFDIVGDDAIRTDASRYSPSGESDTVADVTRALGTLSDSDRRIAEAHWLRGDRVGEIAADLGYNHSTVSRRLREIAVLLRDALCDGDYVLAT